MVEKKSNEKTKKRYLSDFLKDVYSYNEKNPEKQCNDDLSRILYYILNNYMKSGFASLNKGDIDLIFFAAMMKYTDMSSETDYEISKLLRITPQRVRALKEKYAVKYAYENMLEEDEALRKKFCEEFMDLCKSSSRIDGLYVDIPVYDIALKNFLNGEIEKSNLLLHTQLNSKIFRIRIDDLFKLTIALYKNYKIDSMKKFLDNLLNTLKENNEAIKKDLKEFEAPKNIKELIDNITNDGKISKVKDVLSFMSKSFEEFRKNSKEKEENQKVEE